MKTIGDRVRQLREAQGLNRQELADLVGMKKTTLQTLEEMPQKTSKHLPDLARYFGVSLDWLTTGAGAMLPPGPASASQSATLDPRTVNAARTLAVTMLASDGVAFDQSGDATLFAAAYDLVADPSLGTRANFDAALDRRVTAGKSGGSNERGTHTADSGKHRKR